MIAFVYVALELNGENQRRAVPRINLSGKVQREKCGTERGEREDS